MTDIFLQQDITALLKNKHVVLLGDSNVRGFYKDLLCLSRQTTYVSNAALRAKMEKATYGDRLIFHARKTCGRDYREEREANFNNSKFSFYFLTRVYNEYVNAVLEKITRDKNPDVLIINSCVWDVNRWGPTGVEDYQKNLVKLMKRLNEILSKDCLVIWLTTPPMSVEMKGGFLIKQLDFLKYSLRFHIMEANNYARKVVVSHGYDILDIHYHLKMVIQQRADDGIHWSAIAVRQVTNLILTHISIAWGVPLPHRYKPLESLECDSPVVETASDGKQGDALNTKASNQTVNNESTPKQSVVSRKRRIIEQIGKENVHSMETSKRKKRRKNKASKTVHSFINHEQNVGRAKRIRGWQSTYRLAPQHSSAYASLLPDPPTRSPYAPMPSPYSPYPPPQRPIFFQPQFQQPNFNFAATDAVPFGFSFS